jgi:hypothetical protein
LGSRPLRSASIADLETLFRDQRETPGVLAQLRDELRHRTTNRSLELLAQVEAIVPTGVESLADPTAPPPPDNGPVTSGQIDTDGVETEQKAENEDESWGDYPLDTLLIRNENRTVFDVVRRMDKGSFVMDPDFQRDFIWPIDKQSKLIESVLMRIPLPVFYLAEDDLGRMVVVDGLQRLSTFQRFFRNELRLRLPGQEKLDKKKFEDLAPKLQNRVEDCNLVLYVIDAKVPERARLDIFERVNGGVPLTRQQMRNCLYMGSATRFLKEEARKPIFRDATGGSLKEDTMRDREFVNRFCAFQLQDLDEYKGDMDDFLACALRRMNTFDPNQFIGLSKAFERTLKNNYLVFGKHSFRKHTTAQSSRGVLNASLWDVMSTGLSGVATSEVQERQVALREAFASLMQDELFLRSITYSPNSTSQVRHRFRTTRQLFKEIFGASTA